MIYWNWYKIAWPSHAIINTSFILTIKKFREITMRKEEELSIVDDMCCPFCHQGNQCNNARVAQNTSKRANADVQTCSPEPINAAANNQQQLKTQNTLDCWCFVASIPQALIDLVPANSQHKQCICQRCVNAFSHDPCAFKRKYCCSQLLLTKE